MISVVARRVNIEVILWRGAEETAGEDGCVASETDDAASSGAFAGRGEAALVWLGGHDVADRAVALWDGDADDGVYPPAGEGCGF